VPIDLKDSLKKIKDYKTEVENKFKTLSYDYDSNNPLVPSQYLLIGYKFHIFLENLPYDERIIIILNVLVKCINGIPNDIYHDICDYVLMYYDTPKTYSFVIRNKRDIYDRLGWETDESINNSISGFQSYNDSKDYCLYLYNKESSSFILQSIATTQLDSYRTLIIKDTDVNTSYNDGIFGYLKRDNKNKIEFYLVNKKDGVFQHKHNRDGTEQKKNNRKGAVCGTSGPGAKHIPDLEKIIKDGLNSNINVNDITKPNLCLEIQLLLRHNELYNPIVNKSTRFFYRYEEQLLQK